MAYIYLEELEKILPSILDQWIDENDESWEWIFQEIEQKCHVGKKKVKKTWKSYAEDYVSGFRSDIRDLNDWYRELNKKVDELNNKISNLSDKYISMVTKVNHMHQDITAAKSMAETAKQRTEVDYSKYSGKSDCEVSYCNPEDKDCKTCKYYCNEEAIKEHCVSCDAYQCWEAKENG